MSFSWIRDQKVENKLRHELGLKFEVETVNLTEIDYEHGLKYQARMVGVVKGISQDAVVTMAIDMAKEHAAFPMIVLQKPPRGKYWQWSGNNRLKSYELAFPEATTIQAYIVTVTNPVMLDTISADLNEMESTLGFSADERAARARWLHDQHQMPVPEAAKRMGIKPERVYKWGAAQTAKELLKDVPGAGKFAKTMFERLHALADSVPVLRHAAAIVARFNMGCGDELNHLIADVKGKTSEIQKLAELGRWEKMLEARRKPERREENGDGKGKVLFTRNNRKILFNALTTLDRLLEKNKTTAQLQITDEQDRKEATDLAFRVVTKLNKALREGGK